MSTTSRDDTRGRLLAAARRVLATDGVQAARMEDVAQAAEISRQALYYHFHSKQELVAALLREVLVELGGDLRTALAEGPVESVVPAFLDFYRRNCDLGQVLVQNQSLDIGELLVLGEEQVIAPVVERLEADVAAGRVRPLDPELTARAIFGMLDACVLVRALADAPVDLDHAQIQLTDLVRRLVEPDRRTPLQENRS